MGKLWMLVLLLGTMMGTGWAQNDGRTTYAVFPLIVDGHFADGSYYRSTFLTSNPSMALSSSCMATAYVEGQSASASETFGANAWSIDPTEGTQAFFLGYATLSCSQPVNANVLYSYYNRLGQKLGEATVFASPVASLLQILADQTGGARLGIAIVNDQNVTQTATIMVGDAAGSLVASVPVVLGPHRTISKFLDEITGRTITQGQVLIQCASGCAAIGLRSTGAVFTTIPASVRIP